MSQLQFRPLVEGDSQNIKRLFLQLTDNNVDDIDFGELVSDPKCHCIVAQIDDEIIGFGSLIRHTVPSKGEVGRIEDVIIDEKYRGKGYGREMMNELISIAKEENIHELDLTSKRIRTEARELYESLGFKIRESDTYRLHL